MRFRPEALQALGLDPNQRIVTTAEELPELPEGHMRIVHLTHPYHVKGILRRGLNYSHLGMLCSTARAYSQAEDAKFSSDAREFSYPRIKAIVLDMTAEEHRVHERITTSPGVIPPHYIVGILNGSRRES